MKTVTKVLPHLSIVLSGMLIVFCVIDRFNSAMGFLDNDAAKLMIFALSILSIIHAMALAASQRRREREVV